MYILIKHTSLSCLIFLIDNLLIDYQFTFSLIQEDDNHYTAINFMASPEQVTISGSVLSQATECDTLKL